MVRREVILKSIVMIAIVVVWLSAAPVKADIADLGYYQQGSILSNSPNYDWWYGCSPTSAGMMMGYYDRNGFDNLVPGGTAELSTFPAGTYIANDTIASSGHIAAFYNVGTDYYGNSDGPYMDYGDDLARAPSAFNCLADFMGTSQDSTGNPNGSTGFYYYTNGTALHDYQLSSPNLDGMYGIGEYINYRGYDTTTEGLYTQLTDNNNFGHPPGLFSGFTFADYTAEIDAGRPVMIHVEGHSMFGYGYVDGTTTINVYDTWNDTDGGGSYLDGQNPGTMTWGGWYPYGPSGQLDMWGVTVVTLVPVPATVLLGILGMGVVGIKLRKYA